LTTAYRGESMPLDQNTKYALITFGAVVAGILTVKLGEALVQSGGKLPTLQQFLQSPIG
jgi:hypothetical protein